MKLQLKLIVLLSTLLTFSTSSFAIDEIEPNDTIAASNTVNASSPLVIKGTVFPNADVDIYNFQASAGDKIYAATMTSATANLSVDSVLTLLQSDGVTVLETDLDDGSFGITSSGIAGATIPADGFYYLRVKHNIPAGQIRPYYLYLAKVGSAAPITAETEVNDTLGSANNIDATQYSAGTVTPAADIDFYTVTLNAGETIFASLDLDPERDATTFNGVLSIFPTNSPIIANDTNAVSPNSESLFFTAKEAGNYGLSVKDNAGGGASTSTYRLKVAIFPAKNFTGCTTYSNSTGLPLAIPTGPGVVEHDLNIPDSVTIGDMFMTFNIDHTFFADLDVSLVSPDGTENALFTDIGPVVSAPFNANFAVHDGAALPLGVSAALSNGIWQTEYNTAKLSWYNGSNASGAWKLRIRDDATGDGGFLNSWSITVCPQTTVCAEDRIPSVVYTNNFEGGDGGYTHSGTGDEWEYGLPTFAPVTGCNSGSNCWKTDLDNSYNASSTQTLVSPAIDLTNMPAPIVLSWAHKYHMEAAQFDTYFVDASEVGNPALQVNAFTWIGATMTQVVGNPNLTLQMCAPWGINHKDISPLAGKQAEVSFKVATDTTVQLAGVAIDDVTVTACLADSDADGTADINDGCPNDPAKSTPGICGCGVADADSDGDGAFNCVDSCQQDPAKKSAGVCGCGVAETDSDGDGSLDCVDACPANNALKTSGICGCTTPVDANNNGAFECQVNSELKARLDATKKALKKLSIPKTDKQAKKQRKQRGAFRKLLADAKSFVNANQGAVSVKGTFNVNKELKALNSLQRKVFKLDAEKFSKDKKALTKRITKFINSLI